MVLNFFQVKYLAIFTMFNDLMFPDFVTKVNSIKINIFFQLFPKKDYLNSDNSCSNLNTQTAMT